jgi:hypothetical protein
MDANNQELRDKDRGIDNGIDILDDLIIIEINTLISNSPIDYKEEEVTNNDTPIESESDLDYSKDPVRVREIEKNRWTRLIEKDTSKNIWNFIQKILIRKEAIIGSLSVEMSNMNTTINSGISNTTFFKYLMIYLKAKEKIDSSVINQLERNYHSFIIDKNTEIFKEKVDREITTKNKEKIPKIMLSFLENEIKSPRHSQIIVNYIWTYPDDTSSIISLITVAWIEKIYDLLKSVNHQKFNSILKHEWTNKDLVSVINNFSYILSNVKYISKFADIIDETDSDKLVNILIDDIYVSENLVLQIDEISGTKHLSKFINNAESYWVFITNISAVKLSKFIEWINIENLNKILTSWTYDIDRFEYLINNLNDPYLLTLLINKLKPEILINILEADINIKFVNFLNSLDNHSLIIQFLSEIEAPSHFIRNIKSDKLAEILKSSNSIKKLKYIFNIFDYSAPFGQILNAVDSDRFIKTLEQTIDTERFASLIQNVNYEKVVWIINNIDVDIFISVLNNVNDIEIFTKKLAKLEDYTDFVILMETINVHVFIKLIEVWEIFELINKSSDIKVLVNFLNITPINLLKQLLAQNLYSEYVQLIENIEEERLSAFLDEVKLERLLSYLNKYYDSWIHYLIDFIKWSKNLERIISIFNLYDNDSLYNLLRNLDNIENLNDYLDMSKISPAIVTNTTNTTNLAIVLDNSKLLNFWMLTDSTDTRKIAYIINNIDDISNFISKIDFMNTAFLSKLIIKWNIERVTNFLNEIDVNQFNDLIEKLSVSHDIFIDKLLFKISKIWADKVAEIINDKWRLPYL